MKLFDLIVASLEDYPKDWKIDEFYAVHKSGIKIWVANGSGHIKVEAPTRFSFGFFQRRKILKLINICAERQLIMVMHHGK